MKLGIDIGNYNVKTSEGVLFKSCISNSIEYGNKFDKLIINGEKYYLGTGTFEIEFRKFDKDNYIPLLLGAICKSSNHIEHNLGLGLPIKQYKTCKNELISLIQNTEYDIKFNNIKRKIIINDVKVFPESVAAIIANYNKLNIIGQDIIAVDIGGKTTDIALIRGKKVLKSSQVNVGTIDIYNCIKTDLESKYIDIKINIDDINRYIKNGFLYKGEQQDISKSIKNCNDLFKEIYTELNLNYSINTSNVVLQGGGSDLLGKVFKKKINNMIIDNDLFANANGYRLLLN